MNYGGSKAAIPCAVRDHLTLKSKWMLNINCHTCIRQLFCRSQVFSGNDKNDASVSEIDCSRRNLVTPLWNTVNGHLMTGLNPDLERMQKSMEQYATQLEMDGQFLLEACQKMSARMELVDWKESLPACEIIGEW